MIFVLILHPLLTFVNTNVKMMENVNGQTPGRIMGDCLGLDHIPRAWCEIFHDAAHTYICGQESLSIEDATVLQYRMIEADRIRTRMFPRPYLFSVDIKVFF